jgi:serine/threonine-protein kinase ULK/ATG1
MNIINKINKVSQIDRIGEYEYTVSKESLLGKGSFSKVYKGIYTGPTTDLIEKDTPVAIKIINTSTLSPKSLRILEDESDIMRTLKKNPHPNIVRCYDIYHKYNSIFIVMEYCDSGDLKKILKKPIKEEYVRFYFLQFAHGLKHLHDNNIIHRDIKPRNILLTNSKKTLKIADFGFARYSNDNSLYDTICGSPLYMAPEIMKNKGYNIQTDLWSIGMILYEMLYGFHPYHSCKSIQELKNTIDAKEIDIPPINTPNNDISKECLDLLRYLLQKDVKKRISWEDFLSYPWLTSETLIGYPIINAGSTPVSQTICISPDDSSSTINIIEDYCDSVSSKLNENLESEFTDLQFEGDMQFDIELDTNNNSTKDNNTITIKKVTENSSVLDKNDDNAQQYDIINNVNTT